MKKTLFILALSAAPLVALAAGNHDADHGAAHGAAMQGHDMASMTGADSAVGHAGNPAKITQTIEIVMHDTMRFTPDTIAIRAGDTIRFLIKNAGRIPHEMVIGSAIEMREHTAMMQKTPGMEHAEPNMISLAPGQKGELIWQFTEAGMVDFACLIAGHMEAGMVGRVHVG